MVFLGPNSIMVPYMEPLGYGDVEKCLCKLILLVPRVISRKRRRLRPTFNYQDLLFCRVPINPILGFIIITYKKVGLGSLR